MTKVEFEFELPELEKDCWNCNGEGRYVSGEGFLTCATCDGMGKIITNYGIKVMDFVSRWIDRKDKYQ